MTSEAVLDQAIAILQEARALLQALQGAVDRPSTPAGS